MKFTPISQNMEKTIELINKRFDVGLVLHSDSHFLMPETYFEMIPHRHGHLFCEKQRHEKKEWLENCREDCYQNPRVFFAKSKESCQATCWKKADQILIPIHLQNKLALILFAGPFIEKKQKQVLNVGQKSLPLLDKKEISELTLMLNGLARMIEAFCMDQVLRVFSKNNRISKVHLFLDENYQQPITLNDLAQFLNISSSRLSHFLSDEMQQSFSDLLLEKRLFHAKRLLLFTSLSIQEISCNVGIANSNYFYVVFKKESKMSPVQYRKKYQNPI